jgi:SAM-dependent methyltransferase
VRLPSFDPKVSVKKLRLRFEAWHHSDEPLPDSRIDRMLGIREMVVERRIEEIKLLLQYGNQRFTYGGTPYTLARKVMRTFSPSRADIFYDLGAGYGRVLIYGALTTQATFRGIELVPQRVKEARRVLQRLCLPNIEIRQGNAWHEDISDGNLFFFYDPFFRNVLKRVGVRLREIAQRRVIHIGSLAGSNDYFVAQKWLQEVSSPYVTREPWRRYGLRFFISR